jgi:4-hydroxybenzoate polyprenyltransferase
MLQSNAFIRALYFGNYFYGICTVALSIEAALQQYVPLNSPTYYIFVFSASVLYYTYAYIAQTTSDTNNKRSVWYVSHYRMVVTTQILFTIICVVTGWLLFKAVLNSIGNLSFVNWLIIFAFPVAAAFYYGLNTPIFHKFNLRNTGWMKSFVIGFVWGGLVTIYPIMFYDMVHNIPYKIGLTNFLLFSKNFMFITVLCIMFDIKDYATDYNRNLKTFVVRVGLRKTIFYIIIPLTIIGLITFLIYATSLNFPFLRILINVIPFILLIIVAYSMHQRKGILYYLAIIDGLMLVKAICGIIGITLIK